MPEDSLYYTSFRIQDRKLVVDVMPDGGSFWFWDCPQGRASRIVLENQAMSSVAVPVCDHAHILRADAAFKRSDDLRGEFTVFFQLPAQTLRIFERGALLFHKEELTTEMVEALQDCLLPFFWEHINPFLTPPMERLEEIACQGV
jgi:hypothetical protein